MSVLNPLHPRLSCHQACWRADILRARQQQTLTEMERQTWLGSAVFHLYSWFLPISGPGTRSSLVRKRILPRMALFIMLLLQGTLMGTANRTWCSPIPTRHQYPSTEIQVPGGLLLFLPIRITLRTIIPMR